MSDFPALYVRRSDGIVAALGVGSRRIVATVDRRVPTVLSSVAYIVVPTGAPRPPKPPAEVEWPYLP